MSVGPPPQTQTFLDALVAALERASAYNRQDQAPPAAVLWPDKDRQWESLVPRLRDRLPLFTLGPYAPEQGVGPAYWLRCIIAGRIPHPSLGQDQVPILFLPSYSRQEVRAVETCPRELQPLAELQYRGVLWTQRNGRDWTIAAFLQSEDGGLGIEVAADAATREALLRSLLKLADEPVEALHREAPIRGPFLNGLLHPDEVRDLLRWLNDPKSFRAGLTTEGWEAFVALCQTRYQFHPEKDGPITAARSLGLRAGAWDKVWRRFAEAPASYAGLPEALRQARPSKLPSFVESPEAWPQENDAAEAVLRQALLDVANLNPQAARGVIADLEKGHGYRRAWVWAALGQTSLGNALEHLAILARETVQPLGGSSVNEISTAYAERGWRADLALLDALAAVERTEDFAAVRVAAQTIYRPWLEAGAVALQEAVAAGGPPQSYAAMSPPSMSSGTCVLFTDGLRFDAAQRLKGLLEAHGLQCSVESGLAALPTVTATAKPAISPAASAFGPGSNPGLEPVLSGSGSKVTAEVLRKALRDMGVQILKGEEVGDPSGSAWTELGDIDDYGHDHGWRVAHHLDAQFRMLARRVTALLEHGWRQVVVVTDHGWLLLPGGLPKADLPEHLTEVRKGRCARLKDGAKTDHQVVPWHWDSSVRFAVAPGIHCFEAGKEYEHGGVSPQECVVPMLTVTSASAQEQEIAIQSVSWRRLRCDFTVSGAGPGTRADVRTRPGDPNTSLARGGKEVEADGAVSLLVEDDDQDGREAWLVVLAGDGTLRAQVGTVVGG